MAKKSTDYEKLKKPNQATSYTPDQLNEFINCAKDPLYFMENFMYIQHPDPARGKIKFEAYEFQKKLINCYWKYKDVVAKIARQSGKTTTAAGFLLWYAMFNSDITILIAAHKFKAASEIMSRVKFAYESMPNHVRCGVIEYNVQSIKFDNNSRIIATTTTPDSGIGMSISLLYCDEFSHLKPNIADSFWASMSPTLATGGKCIVTSTPMSDEDMFAKLWHGAITTTDADGNEIPDGIGINRFKAFSADYSEVPGRDEKWADEQRAKIGDEKFAREYGCEFAGEETSLISGITLSRLTGTDPLFKTGEIRWYSKISTDKTYVVALDPGFGIGQDAACVQVWSLPDMNQVAEWNHSRTSIPNQVKTMQTIINSIYHDIKRQGYKGEPEIYFTLENNSLGEAALLAVTEIGEENFMGQFLHEPKKFGMVRHRKGLNTNGRSKLAACTKLKSLIESDKLNINSKLLITQLKFFVSAGGSYAAKQGQHDDTVMATMLCVRLMQMVTNWDDRVGEMMKDVFDDEETSARDPMPFAVMFS